MKLELIGHDEKYAVEQSLLTLFPDERPVYGPVTDEDASAARITLTEDADSVCVTTELRCGVRGSGRPPRVRGGAGPPPPPTATAIPSPARTTKRKGSAATRWA